MTKKTTKKTAKQSPYKFKKGDRVSITVPHHEIKTSESLTVLSSDGFVTRCKSEYSSVYQIANQYLKLIPPPRTVLTIKTSKGCAKIIKSESGFHVQSKSNNNEIVQHSELLGAKQNAIENILATFEIYNSAEMRAWAKEEKRKMKK